MRIRNPWNLIFVGFGLLLLGFVLPVLMIIDVISTTLWLSILSHGASVSGLMLGLFGAAMVSKVEEKKDAPPQSWWE